MLDENKTLTECKIKDNYVIHAIFKKNIQNSQGNNENSAPELESRKCRIIIFLNSHNTIEAKHFKLSDKFV